MATESSPTPDANVRVRYVVQADEVQFASTLSLTADRTA